MTTPVARGLTNAVAAIAAAREAFWAAHGRGNAEVLAALVTEDATLFAPGAEAIEGRDAIRVAAGSMFAALTVTDLRIESTELQVHRPLAYELATYSETLTPKGGQPSPARGRYSIDIMLPPQLKPKTSGHTPFGPRGSSFRP